MDSLKLRERPEAKIQKEFEDHLRKMGWFVKRTHGNAVQSGWPDTYASHKTIGPRWIEFKLPNMKGSKFTPAQLETFPLMCANGSGVWVITGLRDYDKLFKAFNWYQYLL